MNIPARLRVRWTPSVWVDEVERFRVGSDARRAAERARPALEGGIELRHLRMCSADGQDGTSLENHVKVYVPIVDRPPSARPFGFVLSLAYDHEGPHLTLVAFGERHPARRKARSVYERAHKRIHGRYPGQ